MIDIKNVAIWLSGDDTGLSSKFLAQLAIGNPLPEINYPHDPSDFGRCHRFLERLEPADQDAVLTLASHRSEVWERLVECWDELTDLYKEEWPSGKAPKLYARMQELIKEPECEHCGGTGEVTVDEQVYPGEPHTAPIGTRTCICRVRDEDDDHDRE